MLPSSRRVKKGPGRRPQSAKRQRFVELRERGWSILAAAREVGVSHTTGSNWSRGYKRYRHGRVVRLVPALERLAVRPEVLVAGGADRDRRAAPRGLEHPADRAPAGSGTLEGLARAALQRDQNSGLASLRCPRSRDRASRPQSSTTHRGQRRTEAVTRGASGPTVEPTADQPSLERVRQSCWRGAVEPHEENLMIGYRGASRYSESTQTTPAVDPRRVAANGRVSSPTSVPT